MNMIIKKEAATLERTSANEGVQLQSLTLSEGTIRFEPDVTDYNVTVAEDVTKILVKGVTSDENSFLYGKRKYESCERKKRRLLLLLPIRMATSDITTFMCRWESKKSRHHKVIPSHRQIRQLKVFLSQWLSRVMKMSFFQTPLMNFRLLQKLLPQEIFNMSHMAC